LQYFVLLSYQDLDSQSKEVVAVARSKSNQAQQNSHDDWP
jgi:hypothetical protein